MKRKQSPLLPSERSNSYTPLLSSSLLSGMASRVAERGKSVSGCSKYFLQLFDEQWFFYNALTGRKVLPSPAGLNDGDLATTKLSVQKVSAMEAVVKTASPSSAPRLLRTPSLPPPRAGHGGTTGPEEERVSGGRKLLYSYSSMDAQQSIVCSSSKSMRRKTRPRTDPPHRRCANLHLIMCWEARFRKEFQNKKWRSVGDLETMELQRFKDLGFVFDDMEGLRSRLVRVTPAVGGRKENEGDGRVYLSEAWFGQRSAPPVVLQPASFRPGKEMKERLRFWARAVACEVRQQC